ncbi:GH92 family glycosyl hydrolase [Ekhidna sp.]|uniref:GH92 family glycosyl hydrolase n=1 Tax=Ekhidna sp. TaxID=2608089 RepID=UPI003CCC21CB
MKKSQFIRLVGLSFFLALYSCNQRDESPLDYVNPFIGTGGHGHTFPGATRPFGMVQLSPDTRLTGWDGCSGYHYSDSIVYGFSHTHLSGTGVSDYGDVLLMPFSGEVYFNNGVDGEPGYRSLFSKESEVAEPGYYFMELLDDQISVELTASERVGFHRYTFSNKEDRKVMIDLSHRDEVLDSKLEQVDEFTLTGYRHSKAWAEKQFIFFRIVFDQPIADMVYDDSRQKAALAFEPGSQLKVKVAISAVDEEGAKKNLEAEIQHWDFEKTRKEAGVAWQDQLNKIKVAGGTEKQKTVFYTALYHTMIAPNLYHDVDGRFRGTDLQIHQDTSYTNYTVFSLWDTYRSTHPLYTIIERKRTADFIKTFLNHYSYGGRLPMWELAANYTGCMIGYHAVPVIADAYVKGITNFDTELAFEAMIHSSMQDRLGIDDFRSKGYIPSDVEAESVSKTLEYAYDDWTIAEMANRMGKTDLASVYYQRAQNYKNVFDPATGFMRARNNNRWFYPFEPAEVNFNYTEANSWQYSYYVPQDVETWIDMLGGDQAAEQKLDAIFTADSETSGRDQADITGLIGQYAHGNEPSHHIPYLYNFIGRPDKTQEYVRQIMDELYDDQPDGLSGNEDCGQMSSWLVMSALGFYPVTPGSEDYIIGSPWFKEATITLENGKVFSIVASENSPKNKYVHRLELNGEDYKNSFIKHNDILNGGVLTFHMADHPSTTFGVDPANRPTSKIEMNALAIPAIETGDKAFVGSTKITLSSVSEDADMRYAFSPSDQEGTVYTEPFEIAESTDLYVWSQKGDQKSLVAKSQFFKIPKNRNIELETDYANHYSGGGDNALINFVRGKADFRTGDWQGYEGVDLVATVDLGSIQSVNDVKIGFLQDENSWIFMPLEVSFHVSEDGKNFKAAGKVTNMISYKEKGVILKDFGVSVDQETRYIKVVAKNRGVCPTDHKGAGGKSWILPMKL